MHAASDGKMQRVLKLSLCLTLGYVVLTFVAGLRAHSLALLSESGHNLSDFLALLLSFVAMYFQLRPATDAKTFGYQRAGVLAAFVNALTLVIIAVWLAYAALLRLSHPPEVEPRLMIYVAAAGVLMNAVIATMLWKASHDVNIRSVFIHMLGDAVSTAAVIVGGLAIVYTGQRWIDPALSLVIAGLILWSAVGIIRETLNILLEGTPRGLSLPQLRDALKELDGVKDVHDLHVWNLSSETRALACHIVIADIPSSRSDHILQHANEMLRSRFSVHHTTIQFETHGCEVEHGCIEAVEFQAHNHHHGHSH